MISGEIERLNTEVLDLHSGINITTTSAAAAAAAAAKKVSYHKQNAHQHSWSTM